MPKPAALSHSRRLSREASPAKQPRDGGSSQEIPYKRDSTSASIARTWSILSLHRELETEYERNGEGSYVLETAHPVKDIGRLCFDATRRYRDVRRLINHSPRPNLKLGRPHYLREKWRIGLLALYDIP